MDLFWRCDLVFYDHSDLNCCLDDIYGSVAFASQSDWGEGRRGRVGQSGRIDACESRCLASGPGAEVPGDCEPHNMGAGNRT